MRKFYLHAAILKGLSITFSTLLMLLYVSCAEEINQGISEQLFKTPPRDVRPKTWMHAMSGNMSREGLTKDFESLAEVGIGGLLLFNITQGIPNGPVQYNSEEHHALLAHAAKEAQRLGLSFGIHNCDGWSASGGPWVSPAQSMKMVVWREVYTQGGPISIQIPQPTSREGFYEDIAVLAFPSLSSAAGAAPAKVTASHPDFDLALATDGRWDESSQLEAGNDNGAPWIQFDYTAPITLRSAFLVFRDRHAKAELQVSDDGVDFKKAVALEKVRTGKGEWAIADGFEGVSGQFFRLQFNQKVSLKEVELSERYSIDNLFGRNAMARTEDAQLKPIGTPADKDIIQQESILDLSQYMDPAGMLRAELPPGEWTIMRFGYTSTGAFNNPASLAGRGLEVDKLNREAFKSHYDAFVKQVVNKAKPLAPDAFQYVEIDSYEMGGQNWTDSFEQIFQDRYGYSLRQFLPLIAGRFVGGAEVAEAVLWDYRNLISDLMTKNYFAYFTELCHADGLKSYIEPYGFGPLNDLEIGGKADLPMGEFWMNRPVTMVASAVSSAHIYGKNVISAESFTSNPEINWKGHPAMAKRSGDRAWASGINEFMFHRFAHQANTHVEPGMTMNRWGFHFDRTQTWWKNAGAAWFTYIARGSYLLRQGVPVADLLVFVGDGSPNSVVDREDFTPAIPSGIKFDCVNADVLINRLQVEEGKLMLPEGTSYRALIIRNAKQLSLGTLQRLVELKQQGALIGGELPQELGGYGHSAETQSRFIALKAQLEEVLVEAGSFNIQQFLTENGIEEDFKIEGRNDIDFAHRALPAADLYFLYNPDSLAREFKVRFRMSGKKPERWNPIDGSVEKLGQFRMEDKYTLVPIRLLPGASAFVVFRESLQRDDLFVINNNQGDISFTSAGGHQLFAAIEKNGTYQATLSNGSEWRREVNYLPVPLTINSPWLVKFHKSYGPAKAVAMDSLIDWKDYPLDSVRYYAGTATYRTSFSMPADLLSEDTEVMLDLGDVHIVAAVKVNGKALGVLWMPPFIANITDVLKPGENKLEIEVTNQWSNRLIGDEQYPAHDGGYELGHHGLTDLQMPDWYVKNEPLPAGPRNTFTTAPFYQASDSLMPSGLKGPVKLLFRKKLKVANMSGTSTSHTSKMK
jgi:hypothetical protein